MNDFDIKVSVYCLAYNHEKYIKSALEGFVNQKTDFQYEVIIHDDASADATTEIIREYQMKYPQIIKPIFQKENQYSKGVDIGETIIYPRIKGEYVAICEGDDYWCDENKLQKQADFLDAHWDYSACAHNTLFVNERTKEEFIGHKVEKDCDLSPEDIFLWKDKMFHTSSLMLRKEYFKRPKEFHMDKVGDYPRAIYLIMNGKVRMFHNVSSVYRLYTEGSWSSTYEKESVDRLVEVKTNMINMLYDIDEYSGGKYHEIIQQAQDSRRYEIAMRTGQFRIAIRDYKKLLEKESIKIRLFVFMNVYFPIIMKIYYKIKSIYK